MSKEYDMILKLLPQLSTNELSQVKSRISFLSSNTKSNSDIDDWLLKGIIKVASDKGFSQEIPRILLIPTSRSFRGYRDKSQRVRDLFEHAIEHLTKTEKYTLGQLLSECLCAKLSRYRSVSFLAMMHSVEMIPEAFEEAFPGYLQMGLARVPLRGLISINERNKQKERV